MSSPSALNAYHSKRLGKEFKKECLEIKYRSSTLAFVLHKTLGKQSRKRNMKLKGQSLALECVSQWSICEAIHTRESGSEQTIIYRRPCVEVRSFLFGKALHSIRHVLRVHTDACWVSLLDSPWGTVVSLHDDMCMSASGAHIHYWYIQMHAACLFCMPLFGLLSPWTKKTIRVSVGCTHFLWIRTHYECTL